MDLAALVPTVVVVTTILGSHALLRKEFKSDIGRLEQRIESRMDRLDDRVYQLAAGLKPLVEQAERQA